jgi:NADH:ubiquinone oxidoreductase subunit E
MLKQLDDRKEQDSMALIEGEPLSCAAQTEETAAQAQEVENSACNCSCSCGEEPSEEELLARLDEVIAGYKSKPGALIPVLQIAQGIYGFLPEVALKRIAKGLNKPYSEVAGVVGFYSFFTTVPRGRNLIRVCLGTACYVRGGIAVLDSLKKELGVDVGDTTEDREFSLEVARCFGACGLAPVITINDDVHHRVKPKRVREILAQYAAEPVAAERSA